MISTGAHYTCRPFTGQLQMKAPASGRGLVRRPGRCFIVQMPLTISIGLEADCTQKTTGQQVTALGRRQCHSFRRLLPGFEEKHALCYTLNRLPGRLPAVRELSQAHLLIAIGDGCRTSNCLTHQCSRFRAGCRLANDSWHKCRTQANRAPGKEGQNDQSRELGS